MNSKKAYFFGFSYWKMYYVKPFFPEFDKIIFCSSLLEAKENGIDEGDTSLVIWGKKNFKEIEVYADEQGIDILRVEDGFIRSVGLGSDLTRPYSLVIDRRGIYFDPSKESDLEYILKNTVFDTALKERAQSLIEMIVSTGISKYNTGKKSEWKPPQESRGKRIVLVPGQVEDDASVLLGAKGMHNIELLQEVRKNVPDGYVVFKPHPDVVAGNRKGDISQKEALAFCDEVVTDVMLDTILSEVTEVHTMTSLVGFEGIIRGKEVYTYGIPFYAGWGLTYDYRVCERRERRLHVEELVAGVLLCYPRYIDIHKYTLCEAETLIEQLEKKKNRYHKSIWYRAVVKGRNFFFRKIQLLKKVFG